MDEPRTMTYSVNVTVNVSFTDTIVGAMYADATEEDRQEMLVESIADLLATSSVAESRRPFVTYEVARN